MYKTIQTISKDIKFIKEYILSQTKDNYSINRCIEILKEKKYITTTEIENDTFLKTRYHQRDTQNKLLSEILESDNELKEIRRGRGNKRYIFYKKDENYVINEIRFKKVTNKKSIRKNEFEDISIYFKNYEKHSISIEDAHNVLRKEFNIKDQQKRRRFFQDLKQNGTILKIENNRFYLSGV